MASRRCRSLLAFLAASLAAGCASPGEPTARRPIVPQAVQDLQARQQGDDVVLTFTLPTQSTRNEPLATPPAIEIYRGAVEPGGNPPGTSTDLIYTIPGELADSYDADGQIVYRDAIVAGGATAGAEQVYAVRTRAARNRASTESNRVTVHLYPPPQTVSNLSARVAGQSVALSWPREADAGYRVYRAEIAPESAAAASTDASQAVVLMPLVQVAQMTAPASDANASLPPYQDENVEFGHAYLYIVRRVAQFDDQAVESTDSPAAVITVAEAVPPAAPQDLEAVVLPAAESEPASVSLAWAITSGDVAGYAVYRSEQEGVRGVRLNGQLLGSPTYRDGSVAAGRRYFYSVTAVDTAGQESAPSAAVEAQIPGP